MSYFLPIINLGISVIDEPDTYNHLFSVCIIMAKVVTLTFADGGEVQYYAIEDMTDEEKGFCKLVHNINRPANIIQDDTPYEMNLAWYYIYSAIGYMDEEEVRERCNDVLNPEDLTKCISALDKWARFEIGGELDSYNAREFINGGHYNVNDHNGL